MMYMQFFRKSPTTGKLYEACGDRAVVILDGRTKPGGYLRWADKECVKRGFDGFQCWAGDSFLRSQPITQIYVPGELNDAK